MHNYTKIYKLLDFWLMYTLRINKNKSIYVMKNKYIKKLCFKYLDMAA